MADEQQKKIDELEKKMDETNERIGKWTSIGIGAVASLAVAPFVPVGLLTVAVGGVAGYSVHRSRKWLKNRKERKQK